MVHYINILSLYVHNRFFFFIKLLSLLRLILEATKKVEIKYSEVVLENHVRKLEVYVEEMTSGDTVAVDIQKVQDDVLK